MNLRSKVDVSGSLKSGGRNLGLAVAGFYALDLAQNVAGNYVTQRVAENAGQITEQFGQFGMSIANGMDNVAAAATVAGVLGAGILSVKAYNSRLVTGARKKLGRNKGPEEDYKVTI